ncbi:MAG TPA: hypothetical protein DEQ50_06570 [Lactobacillus sp.]|nr:hypothetical protein [Lactobacillus sp.]
MENQDIDLIGETVGNMPYKIGIVDQNGNLKNQFVAKASTNRIDIPEQLLNGSGSTGGNAGGVTNPNHPTVGADYYAGSLADGEITERYLLYQRDESVSEKTGSQTVTLLRDVGATFNMAGDGATFLIHLQRTAMTKGAKGAVTDIELNYDPNNVVKDGYFTTTSPYPVYTKSADLATLKTLAIPINGIGENLSGKNVKAPQLNILFNGDGTMTFESVTGYDNDGDSAGATGANYDLVVDVIATFSTQSSVAQLPESINYFSGSVHTNKETPIVLSGVSDGYENSSDGLLINFKDYAYLIDAYSNEDERYYRISITDLGLKSEMVIPKEKLIIGNTFKLLSDSKVVTGNIKVQGHIPDAGWNNSSTAMVEAPSLNLISINKGNITVKYVFNVSFGLNTHKAFLDIQSITPYRK